MPVSDVPLGTGLTDEVYRKGRKAAHDYAREAGYPEEGWVEQTVRWGDMDAFRHVNNTRYAVYLEAGRIRAVDKVRERIPPDDLEGQKLSMVISHLGIKFVKAATAPDVLLIAHRIVELSAKRFQMEAVIISFRHEWVVATGTAMMRAFDLRQQKGRDFPDSWVQGLRPLATPECLAEADSASSRAKL